MKISSLEAYPIYDSRGNPTIEVELRLSNGVTGYGLVPSGASTGQFEAQELRDGDEKNFRGQGVYQAVENVQEEIAQALVGCDVLDQAGLDQRMIALDGTANKGRLGANAILGVSLAAASAAAVLQGVPLFESLGGGRGSLLPLPEVQIIGGGAHANWRTDIQDFLVIATGAETYSDALKMTFDVYHAAGDLLKTRGKYCGVADEGGYWPEFETNENVLDFMLEAIELAGYSAGEEVCLSLDVAASDLYNAATQTYDLRLEGRRFDRSEFVDLMIDWCHRYPIVSVEDPAADVDWESWQRIYQRLGNKVQIVGDDLFTTNVERIRQGVERRAANSVLIKVNQIGTVTETIDAIRMTQDAGWLPIVSARSGETEDAFISHLAVATNAGQLKVGSFARSERMAKWNECLRIERALGPLARFEGARIYQGIFAR